MTYTFIATVLAFISFSFLNIFDLYSISLPKLFSSCHFFDSTPSHNNIYCCTTLLLQYNFQNIQTSPIYNYASFFLIYNLYYLTPSECIQQQNRQIALILLQIPLTQLTYILYIHLIYPLAATSHFHQILCLTLSHHLQSKASI